jgi:hypothetical protein
MTQLIRAANLSWMRDMQAQIRPDSGTIYRFSEGAATSDGMGGYNDAESNWLAVGTSTLRVRPMDLRGRGEVTTGGQLISLNRWDLTLDYDAVVTPKDRIKSSDRVYEITRINNDETWQTAVRVEAVTYNEETSRG